MFIWNVLLDYDNSKQFQGRFSSIDKAIEKFYKLYVSYCAGEKNKEEFSKMIKEGLFNQENRDKYYKMIYFDECSIEFSEDRELDRVYGYEDGKCIGEFEKD
jgi:hypothetical protein